MDSTTEYDIFEMTFPKYIEPTLFAIPQKSNLPKPEYISYLPVGKMRLPELKKPDNCDYIDLNIFPLGSLTKTSKDFHSQMDKEEKEWQKDHVAYYNRTGHLSARFGLEYESLSGEIYSFKTAKSDDIYLFLVKEGENTIIDQISTGILTDPDLPERIQLWISEELQPGNTEYLLEKAGNLENVHRYSLCYNPFTIDFPLLEKLLTGNHLLDNDPKIRVYFKKPDRIDIL